MIQHHVDMRHIRGIVLDGAVIFTVVVFEVIWRGVEVLHIVTQVRLVGERNSILYFFKRTPRRDIGHEIIILFCGAVIQVQIACHHIHPALLAVEREVDGEMTLIDIEAILSREVLIGVTFGSGEFPVLGLHLLLLEDDLGGIRGRG